MPEATLADVTIHHDSAGPDDGPALLLVMGLGAQMIAWPPHLIDPLAAAGVRVVRFDNRDVGRSTWLSHLPATSLAEIMGALQRGAPLPPAYALADMAEDAVGLLDHLGIERAHVVGASMGGMIAQRMALAHPARVASLTSIMSTTGAPGLPRPTAEAVQALLTPAPTDREGYVAALLAKRAVLGSPSLAQDDEWVRAAVEEAFDRGINPAGFVRQYHAILADGDRTAALGGLDLPALVVHGSDDPLIRVQAGEATAAAIPGADLHVVAGMGHDLPPAACAAIAERLLGLLRA